MPDTPRSRLLAALAEAVGERGLPDTTVAEVVRRAGTSRRTFYEHFSDRDDAFLTLYRERGEVALAAAAEAVQWAGQDREAQLRAGVAGLLRGLEGGIGRHHAIDVLGLGDRGLAARRQQIDALAARFRAVIETVRPDAPPLGEALAVAVVGGVQELILRRIERGEEIGAANEGLAEEILVLLRAVVG